MEITRNLAKYEVREVGVKDILAVAAGVLIGIIVWFVVMKGGAV